MILQEVMVGTPPWYRVMYNPYDGNRVVSIKKMEGCPDDRSLIMAFTWQVSTTKPEVRVEIGRPMPDELTPQKA